MSGFFSLILFLVVLTIGFVFEWQKGALEWNSIQNTEQNRRDSACRALLRLCWPRFFCSLRDRNTESWQRQGKAKRRGALAWLGDSAPCQAKRIVIYKFIFPALASRLWPGALRASASGSARFFLPRASSLAFGNGNAPRRSEALWHGLAILRHAKPSEEARLAKPVVV